MAVTDIIKQLSGGMGVTLEIFFVTLITSLIFRTGPGAGSNVQI